MDSMVAVRNRFALFDDEDMDPLEILRQQEEEKQKRKSDKLQVKDKGKSAKPVKQATTASPKKPLESAPKAAPQVAPTEAPAKPRGKPFDRNKPGDSYHDSRESEKNARNRDDFYNSEQRGDRDPDFRRGGRGGYRGGRGGGRGGGDRGRGGYHGGDNRPPRRQFDRHSGSDRTGVKPTEKREGGGSHNWGDISSDIRERKEEANASWDDDFGGGGGSGGEAAPRDAAWEEGGEAKEEAYKSGGDENKDKENQDQGAVEGEAAVDPVKEMTLDEWKREQEAKRAVPKYNLRKPGEGEDGKQWQKSYMLKKKPKEEDEDQDEEEDEDEEEARKGAQKVLLDIQFNFNDSRRGTRGGRGRGMGRGAPRGGGGMRDRDAPPRTDDRGERRESRGGPRGGIVKSKQAAPRVDDFNDFPSLVNA